MTIAARRLPVVAAACLLAFTLTMLTGGVWTALLAVNLSSTPALPWCVPAMALLLWGLWQYLRGRGWPARTSAARRHYLRANSVSATVWTWSLLAGALSIVALTGLWIVLFQLLPMRGNRLPDFSQFPLLTVGLVLVMGSLVNAVAEEAGLRGYLQGLLETDFGGPLAILITALVIAPGHGLTQGFAWPTFLFYLIVDVMFGALAYFTRSILPGIVVHAVGIFAFFAVVWPDDAARPPPTGDAWFYVHVGQAVIFGVAALVAFRRLRRVIQKKANGAPGLNASS